MVTSGSDFIELVDRIQACDKNAEAEFHALFARGVRFFLQRHLGAGDLDDRVHNTLQIVLHGIQQGEMCEPHTLTGFVLTIVRRQVSGYRDSDLEQHRTPHPQEPLANQEQTDHARRLLSRLSSRDREVLTRFYLEEQRPEAICEQMNLTEMQFRLLKRRAKSLWQRLGKPNL